MLNVQAIRTITRRELNDTFTDWRILVPIFILIFFLPQVLIFAAAIAVEVIGDPGTIERLVPFAMLLVGFIPASFSLIAALESFVGERERNSLEALLSMPISDNTLYIGKLLAALAAPLVSSLLAMIIFAVSLAVRAPVLFERGLTLEYFLLVVILIVTKSLVMVAGAVIISSHTSSIKAANLLASFVLLPTAAVVQLESLLVIGTRWDMMRIIALLMVVIAAALVRTGLQTFNREEILSREHEQLNLRRLWATFTTFVRAYRPAGTPPDSYASERFSLKRFYTREFPAILREYRLPICIALFAAVMGIVAGPELSIFYDRVGLNAAAVGVIPGSDPLFGVFVGMRNAIQILISGFLSTFSFGLFSLLVPFFAFGGPSYIAAGLVDLGGTYATMGPLSPTQFLLSYILPHGIFEWPAAILGSAMGIRVGASLMSPPKGFNVGENILWSLAQLVKVWGLIVLPLLLIAGLVQQLVSANVVAALYGG